MELSVMIQNLKQLGNEYSDHSEKLYSAAAALSEVKAIPQLEAEQKHDTQTIMDELEHGRFQYFVDNYPTKNTGHSSLMSYSTALYEYRDSLNRISRDALRSIVYWLTGKEFKTPHEFTIYIRKHGYRSVNIKIRQQVCRGYRFPIPAKINTGLEEEFISRT